MCIITHIYIYIFLCLSFFHGNSGLVFLQYRSETKRALLPNEITSIDTVKALFVRSFPKQLTMEYMDSPLVKIYIHDSSKDMFYELEDLRYEFLKLFEKKKKKTYFTTIKILLIIRLWKVTRSKYKFYIFWLRPAIIRPLLYRVTHFRWISLIFIMLKKQNNVQPRIVARRDLWFSVRNGYDFTPSYETDETIPVIYKTDDVKQSVLVID